VQRRRELDRQTGTKGSVKSAITRIVPELFKRPVRRIVQWRKERAFRASILAWSETLGEEHRDLIRNEIEWIRSHGADVFPYPWAQAHQLQAIRVQRDPGGMPYVLRSGRRLFFPRSWSNTKVREYYRSLLREQSDRSPHQYRFSRDLRTGTMVLCDIGAAEGIWAFDNAHLASHIILCEPNQDWGQPLAETFCQFEVPWTIASTFASNVDAPGMVRIDTMTARWKKNVLAIKMDIEGEEVRALGGARDTLRRESTTLWQVCTYHRPEDARAVSEIFRRNSAYLLSLEASDGFMLFPDEKPPREPYLRKGLLRVRTGKRVEERMDSIDGRGSDNAGLASKEC
jgi:hypothetical protein